MKKIIFLTLALGLGLTTTAQKKNLGGAINRVAHLGEYQQSVADPNQPATSVTPVQPKTIVVAHPKSGLSATRIGTSSNMLNVQMPNLRCISSFPNMNAISFTYRGGGSMGSDANHVITTYSLDGGLTFHRLILSSSQSWANRYSSGVLYNPIGNITPNDLHLAYCGPFFLSGVWRGYYFCSERLDKTDSMYNYHHWTISPSDIEPDNLSSCTDGYVHAFTPYIKDTTTTTNSFIIPYYTDVYNGVQTSSEDTIQWNSIRMRLPACVHSTGTPIGTLLYSWGQAWSEDGTVGYIYYFGVDSITPYNNSVVPIVYKSTTQGSTWMKLSSLDFSTLSNIRDSIYPLHTNSSLHVPAIFGSEYDYQANSGVVDANGNLHICTTVCGEYSNYTDSVGYTYTYEPIKLYDLYTTSTGWGANYISRINSLGVLYTDIQALPSLYTGTEAIGWNHRIHTSRTKDGTMLFVTYVDEYDTSGGFSKLLIPDLYSYGWNVNTGYNTGLKNFTHNTIYDGYITWMYATDRVLEIGTDYVIPVTFTTTGNYEEDTCAYYYLSGITFPDPYVGIDEIKENNNINVYPNPATDNLTIDVSATLNTPATIEITNIEGQVIKQQTTNTATTNIVVSALARGMYFVKIKTEKGVVVKKFVKE